MSGEGLILRGITDALLALYGEPEPYALDTLEDISNRLHTLADERRSQQGRGRGQPRPQSRDLKLPERNIQPKELLGPQE